jgi:REP element-mobilizing transposase RayT
MSLYENKYRIEPTRLTGFDYGSNAAYFITICTKDRINYLGNIVETDNYPFNVEPHDYASHSNETGNCPFLQKTPIANITEQFWFEIPQHYPFVILDEFIIMPNHIHGIIIINKNDVETHDYASHNKNDNASHNNKTDNRPSLHQWQENKFGVQSKNIPAIIRGFKSSVKKFANLNNIEFEWQTRYYDRIMRDEDEMQRTRIYINRNIENWRGDENYLP